VANMSHELRTPLTAIVGYSSVLLEGFFGELNAEQTESLQAIANATEHLKSLINDVLDMARVESGKEEANPKEIELVEVVPQILKLMMQTAAGKNITLNSPDMKLIKGIKIHADNRHIRQILINIFSNAIKYTPPGGRVGISVKTEADKAVISVTDTGVGIADSDRNKVFQEYSRMEDEYSQMQVGTGLGLNLTKKLVELNGGTISFDSKLGEGSTFYFSMPLYQEREEGAFLENIQESAVVFKQDLPKLEGLKILVLEDNKFNLQLMQTLLTSVGAEVVMVENCEEAFTKSNDVDLALVDLALKGESGNEYISRMREHGSDVPMIVVSACVFENDRSQARKSGATSFIAKPYEPIELVTEIRRLSIERVLNKV